MDIVSSIVFISCPSLRTCSENRITAGTTVENKGKLILLGNTDPFLSTSTKCDKGRGEGRDPKFCDITFQN